MPVFKRGGMWYYAFAWKGRRYRKAVLGAESKWDAEQAESQAKRDVFLGLYGKVIGNTKFSEYAKKQYTKWAKANKRSWKSDSYHVECLAAFFKGKSFNEITPMLVEKYKKTRLGISTRTGKRTPATVNREIACLSKIFSLAMRDGYAQANPCLLVKKLREPGRRNRYLS